MIVCLCCAHVLGVILPHTTVLIFLIPRSHTGRLHLYIYIYIAYVSGKTFKTRITPKICILIKCITWFGTCLHCAVLFALCKQFSLNIPLVYISVCVCVCLRPDHTEMTTFRLNKRTRRCRVSVYFVVDMIYYCVGTRHICMLIKLA